MPTIRPADPDRRPDGCRRLHQSASGSEDIASHVLGAGGSHCLDFEFTTNGPLFVTSLGYFNAPGFDAGAGALRQTYRPARFGPPGRLRVPAVGVGAGERSDEKQAGMKSKCAVERPARSLPGVTPRGCPGGRSLTVRAFSETIKSH